MKSRDATHELWPHDFAAKFRGEVSRRLRRADFTFGFETQNTGEAPFTFEIASHTYFRVSDVRNIQIEGLEGKTYLDNLDGSERKIQNGAIAFSGETDRVYLDSGGPITLRDRANIIQISGNESWRSTVVWNPWIDKSRALADLGDDEWPGFVCIESGAIADDAVTLGVGEKYTLSLQIDFRTS
ncbi:MAG TPA: hypothetical protein VGB45_01720 [Abditibacterium sp.]